MEVGEVGGSVVGTSVLGQWEATIEQLGGALGIENHGSKDDPGTRGSRIQILAPPLSSCVILGELTSFSFLIHITGIITIPMS